MRIAHVLIAGILGTALLTQFAVADTDGERSALARIAHELEALEPLIREAVSQANPDVRIRFRYDWLRQDLSRIRQGIQEHIDVPRAEPRTFPLLRSWCWDFICGEALAITASIIRGIAPLPRRKGNHDEVNQKRNSSNWAAGDVCISIGVGGLADTGGTQYRAGGG